MTTEVPTAYVNVFLSDPYHYPKKIKVPKILLDIIAN